MSNIDRIYLFEQMEQTESYLLQPVSTKVRHLKPHKPVPSKTTWCLNQLERDFYEGYFCFHSNRL